MLETFAWLLLSGVLTAPHASADLMREPAVQSFCGVLAREAMADRSREHGAFVVRTDEGMLYFVAWPPSGERQILRWYGRFPKGTVAILHTHPAGSPMPSRLDAVAARGAHVPVYVLTRRMIARTTGEAAEVVIEGDWLDRK